MGLEPLRQERTSGATSVLSYVMFTKKNHAALLMMCVGAFQGWAFYSLIEFTTDENRPSTVFIGLSVLCLWTACLPLSFLTFPRLLTRKKAWYAFGGWLALSSLLAGYISWQTSKSEYVLSLSQLLSALGLLWLALTLWLAAEIEGRDGRKILFVEGFKATAHSIVLALVTSVFVSVVMLVIGVFDALFEIIDIRITEIVHDLRYGSAILGGLMGLGIAFGHKYQSALKGIEKSLMDMGAWLLAPCLLSVTVFVLFLAFTGLAPVWHTGHASVVLTLVQALILILFNFDYRDGEKPAELPQWIKAFCRWASVVLPILGVLAVYSLGLRIQQYGFTHERILGAWFVIILFVASIGYASVNYLSAFRASPRLTLARVNRGLILGTLVIAIAVNTPLIDPGWLSAWSQKQRIVRSNTFEGLDNSVTELRFSCGKWGLAALRSLAKISDHPQAGKIRWAARNALNRKTQIDSTDLQRQFAEEKQLEIARRRIQHATCYPTNCVGIDADFVELLVEERDMWGRPNCLRETSNSQTCQFLFEDLDGDGNLEILEVSGFRSFPVYSRVLKASHGSQAQTQWKYLGYMESFDFRRTEKELSGAFEHKKYSLTQPRYRNMHIGNHTFTLIPEDP